MDQEDRFGDWEVFPGQSRKTLALPDFYSNYFDYSFDRTIGDAKYVGLRITGEFPYARYMSFNIYDAVEGSPHGSKTDFLIDPLPGNFNPFRAASVSNAKNRSYSVTVLPNGYPTEGADNVISFNDQDINVLTVMLRYYVPEGGMLGNVQLPTITAFDVRNGEPVPLPDPHPLRGSMPKWVMSLRLDLVFATADDVTMRFYHAGGAGEFPNADNQYLICAVTRGEGEVLLIRILPPSYPRNNHEYGLTEVRYWSFNEGDYNSSTAFGRHDEYFRKAKDGKVYIAIGDESIKTKAEERGYNFMLWMAGEKLAVILYRNMLDNVEFLGRIENVPLIVPEDIKDKQILHAKEAKNWIGDYAPTGVKVSNTVFMFGNVGITSPGF